VEFTLSNKKSIGYMIVYYRWNSKNYIAQKFIYFSNPTWKVKLIYYIDSVHAKWDISSLYLLELMIMFHSLWKH